MAEESFTTFAQAKKDLAVLTKTVMCFIALHLLTFLAAVVSATHASNSSQGKMLQMCGINLVPENLLTDLVVALNIFFRLFPFVTFNQTTINEIGNARNPILLHLGSYTCVCACV